MRPRCAGQASIEALALVPVMVIAALVTVQLAALVRGALTAQDVARQRALMATGSGAVTVPVTVRVPSVLPHVDRLEVRARAVVRAP